MDTIIAFDSHKRYTFACVESPAGQRLWEGRIEHRRGNLRCFLGQYAVGSPVAVETIGNWYWIVDEIEAAGMHPRLVHARKAKLMLGSIDKTDKLDARGINRLQRVNSLPTVWIPPGEIRDRRELPRVRMVLGAQRTRLKNRLHSVLDKYGLQASEDISDIFGSKGRQWLIEAFKQLPGETRYTNRCLLRQLSGVQADLERIERRMHRVFERTEEIELLMSMPGVGFILAVVIWLEVGQVERFSRAACLASYAGTTPRVHASGGKVRYGSLRPDTNHYLKWAFSEAGNSVAVNRRCYPQRHVSQLYSRIRAKRGHAKAVGAVARHLAEATYWILSKQEKYQDPQLCRVEPQGSKREEVMSP